MTNQHHIEIGREPTTPIHPLPTMSDPQILEALEARHKKEKQALDSRISNKKRNATKKTRKGINEECANLERNLKERHEMELNRLLGVEEEEVVLEDEPKEGLEKDGNAVGKLTEKVGVHIKEETSTPTPTPTPEPVPTLIQQQKQPSKKRNRAKERLARRAAKVAAAQEAAAQEATITLDHRALETTAITHHLTTHSKHLHEIPPDGHCLFAAIADQLVTRNIAPAALAGATPTYRVLRKVAADYVRGHREEFEGFVEGGVDEWTRRIEETAEWGGEVEVRGLAGVLGVTVVVVREGGVERFREGGENGEVWVSYHVHGFGLGEHYNSLREKV